MNQTLVDQLFPNEDPIGKRVAWDRRFAALRSDQRRPAHATRVIRGLLFGVEPHDPVTLVGVSVLMAAIGIASCWVPALRAARVHPAITMRSS